MLAMDYKKSGHRIDYTDALGVYVQPKLDGVRCEAYIDGNDIKFKSRGGKSYSVPDHLYDDLINVFLCHDGIKLDGELYVHGEYLQDIVSAVKKPNELTPKLSFYCFDISSESSDWISRREKLSELKCDFTTVNLEFVNDFYVENEQEVLDYHNEFVENGYEGVMVRQGHGVYKYNHRSPWLQKYKKMLDKEFTIIGHEVDKDGCIVWIVKVPTKKGFVTCKVTPKMSKSQRRGLVSKAGHYYGKQLKVQFQGLSKDGNLQFPVGLELDRTDNT
jgi:ATP-dependent DNA ligase